MLGGLAPPPVAGAGGLGGALAAALRGPGGAKAAGALPPDVLAILGGAGPAAGAGAVGGRDAFPPLPPPMGRGGAPVLGRGAVLEAWYSAAVVPNVPELLALTPGSFLECPTFDEQTGVINGSGLVEVDGAGAPDVLGQFVEGFSRGASGALGGMLLDRLLSATLAPPGRGVIHLCRGDRGACTATSAHRAVFHVDCVRLRARERLGEAWIRTEGLLPIVPHAGEPAVAEEAARRAPAGRDEELRDRSRVDMLRARYLAKREDVPMALASAAVDYSSARGSGGGSRSKRRSRSRSRRRRRRRSPRSTSRSSSRSDSRSDFRGAPSRAREEPASSMVATRPGELYARTINTIAKKVQARGGAGAADTNGLQHFLTYLTAVLHGRYPPEKCGVRTTTELRLVAECLDALRGGDLTQVADLLAARFTALEASVIDGDWHTAKHLDAISDQASGLATLQQRKAALVERRFEERVMHTKGAK